MILKKYNRKFVTSHENILAVGLTRVPDDRKKKEKREKTRSR